MFSHLPHPPFELGQQDIIDFKLALLSKDKNLIEKMWKDDELKYKFSGQLYTSGGKSPKYVCIPLEEQLENFKAALISGNNIVINAMWFNNPFLRAVFTQQLFSFKFNQPPFIYDFSMDRVYENFKLLLDARNEHILLSIWKKNQGLKNFIKRFNPEELTLLSFEVLNVAINCRNDFTAFFIKECENISVLQPVLVVKESEPNSVLNAKKVNLLKRQLQKLERAGLNSAPHKRKVPLQNNERTKISKHEAEQLPWTTFFANPTSQLPEPEKPTIAKNPLVPANETVNALLDRPSPEIFPEESSLESSLFPELAEETNSLLESPQSHIESHYLLEHSLLAKNNVQSSLDKESEDFLYLPKSFF